MSVVPIMEDATTLALTHQVHSIASVQMDIPLQVIGLPVQVCWTILTHQF